MSKYELLKKKVEECKYTNINDINPTEIDEINEIKIDTNISSTDRIVNFISKVKNPYIFKVNDIIVKMTYSSNNVQAMDCIKKIIIKNT